MASALPPRVLLVMTDQWPRALLRAALRDVGYDAVGTRALGASTRLMGREQGRGPVRLVVLAQEALAGADRRDLDRLRGATDAPIVLLASAGGGDTTGPWEQIVHRPVSIGDLVRVLETLVPLPP
jgi:hypothetical protein